jgi:hypothetical protein
MYQKLVTFDELVGQKMWSRLPKFVAYNIAMEKIYSGQEPGFLLALLRWQRLGESFRGHFRSRTPGFRLFDVMLWHWH